MSNRETSQLIETVACKVMGWHLITEDSDQWLTTDSVFVANRTWNPLTDIVAAMAVVEKMLGENWSFACTLYKGKLPYASFCRMTAATSRNAEAESLSTAICLAALKAVNRKSKHNAKSNLSD